MSSAHNGLGGAVRVGALRALALGGVEAVQRHPVAQLGKAQPLLKLADGVPEPFRQPEQVAAQRRRP